MTAVLGFLLSAARRPEHASLLLGGGLVQRLCRDPLLLSIQEQALAAPPGYGHVRGYENNLDASESPFYRDCWQDTLKLLITLLQNSAGNLPFEGGGGGAAAARSGGSTWEYGSGGSGGGRRSSGSGSGSSSSSVTIHEAAVQAVLEFVSCLPLLRLLDCRAASGGGGGGGGSAASSNGAGYCRMGGRSAGGAALGGSSSGSGGGEKARACRQRSSPRLRASCGCWRRCGGLSDVAGPGAGQSAELGTSCRSAPAGGLCSRTGRSTGSTAPDDVSSSSSSALSPGVR